MSAGELTETRGGPSGGWRDLAPTLARLIDRYPLSWPGWWDAATIVLLAALLLRLANNDGGRFLGDVYPALWLALVAVAIAGAVVARWSRVARLLAAGWCAGALVALAFGQVRGGWVDSLTTVALAVPVAMLVTRLWQRTWGPAVVGWIAAIALSQSWYLAFLAWWGGASQRTRWLALAAPNQSGPLMACMGFLGLGVAMVHRGPVRVGAMVFGGAGFAGAWLSGSRATIAFTLVVFVLVVVGGVVQEGVRRVGAALAVVGMTTVGLVLTLTSATGRDPALERVDQGSGNLLARLEFWPPALRMFTEAPLTGTGPGSFRWSARPYWWDTRNLAASPHNEYLEVLGEGGLVWAIPVWAAVIGIAVLMIRTLRQMPVPAVGDRSAGASPSAIPPVHRAARLVALGAAGVLGLHAGFDFDWGFPLLLVALAVAGTVLLMEVGSRAVSVRDRAWQMAVGLSAFLLVGTATVGATLERSDPQVPWNLNAWHLRAVLAVKDGDVDAARHALARIETWNPGSPSLPALEAVVEHAERRMRDEDLAASVDPRHTPMSLQTLISDRLISSGEPELALDVIADLRPVIEAREMWGVEMRSAETVMLEIEATIEAEGCDAGRGAWRGAVPWLEARGLDADEVAIVREDWESLAERKGCRAH